MIYPLGAKAARELCTQIVDDTVIFVKGADHSEVATHMTKVMINVSNWLSKPLFLMAGGLPMEMSLLAIISCMYISFWKSSFTDMSLSNNESERKKNLILSVDRLMTRAREALPSVHVMDDLGVKGDILPNLVPCHVISKDGWRAMRTYQGAPWSTSLPTWKSPSYERGLQTCDNHFNKCHWKAWKL